MSKAYVITCPECPGRGGLHAVGCKMDGTRKSKHVTDKAVSDFKGVVDTTELRGKLREE